MLAAVGCAFAGLCYSEFATMIPIAGSAYTYAYATMGELLAWIIGWDLVLEYAVGAATVSVSWSGYVVELSAAISASIFPQQLAASPFEPVTLPDGDRDPGRDQPAGDVHRRGDLAAADHRHSGIGAGQRRDRGDQGDRGDRVHRAGLGVHQSRQLSRRSFRRTPATSATFGWSGMMRGAGLIFFAFIGFDAVSTAAQEAKNPQRDMPIGIIGSLAVCTMLYVLFAHVLTGMVNYKELNERRSGGGRDRPHRLHAGCGRP